IRLAVIPMGYGDGSFLFHLQDGEVLIGGKRVPITGQIYMDHFLVDVNDISTQLGDEVVIIGEQGKETITAVEVAKRASIGSLNSDLICLLSQRVSRHYIEERME